MTDLTAAERLIVALDVDNSTQAFTIVNELGDTVSFYKVGWQLFIGEGFPLIKNLIKNGKKVFLDLKMDDIEETIRSALANLPDEGIEFLTIHGNGATARAARRGRGDQRQKPKLLSVTYLSSLDETDLKDLFGDNAPHLDDYIQKRAGKLLDAGVEGLIASGQSVQMIRETVSQNCIIVTPGIRPPGGSTDDHKRTLTPFEAITAGADYLVVGRPIRNAPFGDRCAAAEVIIEDIQRGLDAR